MAAVVSHAAIFMIGVLAAGAYRPEVVAAIELQKLATMQVPADHHDHGISMAEVGANGQVQIVPVAQAPAAQRAAEPGEREAGGAGHRRMAATPDMKVPMFQDLRTMSVLVEVGSDFAADFRTAVGWDKMPVKAAGASATLVEIGPPKWWARIGDLRRHLFTSISVAVLVKVACMVGNLLVQVSPMPQAQEWDGKGSTGNTESAPYVAMALGGWQWCTYGLAAWLLTKSDGFLVLVYANCLGALLGSYYTFVFYRNCADSGTHQNLRKYLLVVSCLVVSQTVMWLEMPHRRALALHSCIAGGCSFMGAMSLLTGLPAVFSSGDTSGICGPLVIANFFGAILWAYYGVIINDEVVTSVNLFAAFASALCLYAKFIHRLAAPQDGFFKAAPHPPSLGEGPHKLTSAFSAPCKYPAMK